MRRLSASLRLAPSGLAMAFLNRTESNEREIRNFRMARDSPGNAGFGSLYIFRQETGRIKRAPNSGGTGCSA